MTAIYHLPSWSRLLLLFLVGAILGSLLTLVGVAIWANATIPPMVANSEEAYYRGVYASCLVMAQIVTGLDYYEFQSYCNKITAEGREVDAFNGDTPGYEPGSRERFGGADG